MDQVLIGVSFVSAVIGASIYRRYQTRPRTSAPSPSIAAEEQPLTHAAVCSPVVDPENQVATAVGEMKTCRFCGESILAIAIKCRYCQSMIADRTTTDVSRPYPARGAEPSQPCSPSGIKIVCICGGLVALAFMMLITSRGLMYTSGYYSSLFVALFVFYGAAALVLSAASGPRTVPATICILWSSAMFNVVAHWALGGVGMFWTILVEYCVLGSVVTFWWNWNRLGAAQYWTAILPSVGLGLLPAWFGAGAERDLQYAVAHSLFSDMPDAVKTIDGAASLATTFDFLVIAGVVATLYLQARLFGVRSQQESQS